MSHFFGGLDREINEKFRGIEATRRFLNILLLPDETNIKKNFAQIICEMNTKTEQLNIICGMVGFRPRNIDLWSEKGSIIQNSLNKLKDFYKFSEIEEMLGCDELEFLFGMEDRFGAILTRTISKSVIEVLKKLSSGGKNIEAIRNYQLPDLFYEELSSKFGIEKENLISIANDIHRMKNLNYLCIPYFNNLKYLFMEWDRIYNFQKLEQIANLL